MSRVALLIKIVPKIADHQLLCNIMTPTDLGDDYMTYCGVWHVYL